jgi:hypothetical protein
MLAGLGDDDQAHTFRALQLMARSLRADGSATT